MKKLTQYLIMAAGACVVLGTGLCIAGKVLGGSPGFWIRRDGLYTNQDIRKELEGRMAVLEKTEMDAFDSMDIRMDYNHITVKPSDDGRYYLEYNLYTRKNQPEYGVQDGVLTVTCVMDPEDSVFSGTAGFFVVNDGSSYKSGLVTVYVPENISMDRVKLYNKDGKVTYHGPKAETLDITSSYGGIFLKDAEAENAILTLSDGNIQCDGGSFTRLTLTNKYGNTNLNQIAASSIDIDASDGHLTKENISTGSLTAKNKYGTTVCNTVTADSFVMNQSDGSCTVKNADIKDGRFENKYGNISLELTGRETDYNYDMEMKYGDITLNGQRYKEKNVHKNNGASMNIMTDSNDGHVNIQTR